MKKLLLVLTLCIGIQQSTQAQILISLLLGDKLNSEKLEFGLNGGANFSQVLGMDSNDYLSTFYLGFYFRILMKGQWFFYTGVDVKANMGFDDLSPMDLADLGIAPQPADGEYKQVMKYFFIPALVRYRLKNKIYFELGPQIAFRRQSWVEYNDSDGDSDTRIKTYNSSDINKLDVGIAAGAGYSFRQRGGLTLGLKYYYGFVPVYKDINSSKHSALFFQFNVPIGVKGVEEDDL